MNPGSTWASNIQENSVIYVLIADFATRSLFYNLRARLGEDLVLNVGGPGIKGVACNGSDNISDPRF